MASRVALSPLPPSEDLLSPSPRSKEFIEKLKLASQCSQSLKPAPTTYKRIKNLKYRPTSTLHRIETKTQLRQFEKAAKPPSQNKKKPNNNKKVPLPSKPPTEIKELRRSEIREKENIAFILSNEQHILLEEVISPGIDHSTSSSTTKPLVPPASPFLAAVSPSVATTPSQLASPIMGPKRNVLLAVPSPFLDKEELLLSPIPKITIEQDLSPVKIPAVVEEKKSRGSNEEKKKKKEEERPKKRKERDEEGEEGEKAEKAEKGEEDEKKKKPMAKRKIARPAKRTRRNIRT